MKIIVSGKGGQGIQFLAQMIAKTAIHNGMEATLMKSYGPEARGGASQASVVIDKKPITNPVIKKADYLLAFTQMAVDAWGKNAKNIIYRDNINNMEMLGIFLKEVGEPLSIYINTMRNEISEKYKDRLEANIDNLRKGYNGQRNNLEN